MNNVMAFMFGAIIVFVGTIIVAGVQTDITISSINKKCKNQNGYLITLSGRRVICLKKDDVLFNESF